MGHYLSDVWLIVFSDDLWQQMESRPWSYHDENNHCDQSAICFVLYMHTDHTCCNRLSPFFNSICYTMMIMLLMCVSVCVCVWFDYANKIFELRSRSKCTYGPYFPLKRKWDISLVKNKLIETEFVMTYKLEMGWVAYAMLWFVLFCTGDVIIIMSFSMTVHINDEHFPFTNCTPQGKVISYSVSTALQVAWPLLWV